MSPSFALVPPSPITGVPNPWAADGTGLQPVRNLATQQEVNGGWVSQDSSVFRAASHCSHYHLNSTFCQHYGELYNYCIIYYNVIIIEIKCTINVKHLNHPETLPSSPAPLPPSPAGPWKNCLPWNRSLLPERLGTTVLSLLSLSNSPVLATGVLQA